MQRLGGYLAFFGIGSIILYAFNYNFFLLMWIDRWGTGIGWTIRIAVTLLGGAFYLLGKADEDEMEI